MTLEEFKSLCRHWNRWSDYNLEMCEVANAMTYVDELKDVATHYFQCQEMMAEAESEVREVYKRAISGEQ